MVLKAILVSVDYADLLAITLPYNRHHFDSVMVVTTPTDKATIDLAAKYKCWTHCTNAFYDNGAKFNKWKALEEALDVYGREGWMCIMDADVLWPRDIPSYERVEGNLYTPLRRMFLNVELPIPPEDRWVDSPLHKQQAEFAGYTQIFHASDMHLGNAPWHEINWKHAGGADSFFQAKWPAANKIRPPFEVLHLGYAGTNWCGRASKRTDGTIPKETSERIRSLKSFVRGRVSGPSRFDGEKIR